MLTASRPADVLIMLNATVTAGNLNLRTFENRSKLFEFLHQLFRNEVIMRPAAFTTELVCAEML
jgi:hypothetical protein